MKEYGKIVNKKFINPPSFYRGIINYNLSEKELLKDGYKEVIREDVKEIPENSYIEYEYTEEENKIRVKSVIKKNLQREIALLKESLNLSDYKIIKCIECFLSKEPLPYDILSLHNQRQKIRDKINETEGIL